MFHVDLHPGNLSVLPSDGSIVMYDYGLVIKIPDNLSEAINTIVDSILRQDVNQMVRAMIDADIIRPQKSIEDITRFFQLMFEKVTNGKLNLASDSDMQEISRRLAAEKPFALPLTVVYMFKTISLITGICQTLDPTFSVYEYAQSDAGSGFDPEPLLRAMLSTPLAVNNMNPRWNDR